MLAQLLLSRIRVGAISVKQFLVVHPVAAWTVLSRMRHLASLHIAVSASPSSKSVITEPKGIDMLTIKGPGKDRSYAISLKAVKLKTEDYYPIVSSKNIDDLIDTGCTTLFPPGHKQDSTPDIDTYNMMSPFKVNFISDRQNAVSWFCKTYKLVTANSHGIESSKQQRVLHHRLKQWALIRRVKIEKENRIWRSSLPPHQRFLLLETMAKDYYKFLHLELFRRVVSTTTSSNLVPSSRVEACGDDTHFCDALEKCPAEWYSGFGITASLFLW